MSRVATATLLAFLVLIVSSCGDGESDTGIATQPPVEPTAAAQPPVEAAVATQTPPEATVAPTEAAPEAVTTPGPTPVATPSPTATPRPTPTPESSGEPGATPTPEPEPEATVVPTEATPAPMTTPSPTPVAIPSPTATPTPTPTPESSEETEGPEATPTPEPEPELIPVARPPVVLPAEVPAWPRGVLPNSDPANANRGVLRFLLQDENGVVLTDYGDAFGGAGVQYNPQSVAYTAQILFALFSEGYEYLKDDFFAQANWLVHNAEERDGFLTWTYDFPNASFGAPAPWTSGMAHGRILTTLILAHSLTGAIDFLETAEASLGAFEASMAEGGVRTESDDLAGAWYEEVAGPDVASSKILNGHIFALVGLRDYALYTGSQRAWELYMDGEIAVAHLLPLFDAGHISRYDLAGHVHCKYNRIHARQLNWLAGVTGRELYKKYADRFTKYKEDLGECPY